MDNDAKTELEYHKLVRVQGQLVERDALNIAEKVTAFDPNLYVQYLNQPESITDPPFRVMEICQDGIHRVALTAWQLDERVLQRLMAADTQKFNILDNIDKNNEKIKNEDRRRYQEKIMQLNEMTADVLKSPKDTYTATNPITGEKHKFTN